jgi:hypothetical protein
MTPLLAQGFPGMELIPLIVLMLGAAVLFSLMALATAFFNRRGGITLAALALCAAAAVPLLILAANRWSIFWLPRAMVDGWPPLTPLCGGAILLSLVAALVPLAPDPAEAAQAGAVRRNRRLVFAFVVLPLLVLLGLGGLRLAAGWRGEGKTRALLSGDEGVHLERLRIEWGQRRVICTDPQALRHLEERFRHRDDPNPIFPRKRHGSYVWTLYYEGGGSHTFLTYLYDGGVELSLDDPDGWTTHVVPLPGPLPPPLDEVIKFLHQPPDEVKGTVLIVEAQGIRREFDGSLVAK